ncbi:hypothetical protein DFS34DRAFT_149137 [Phlyctochytrium arcticum]|nr:hypothetical protein DFS34DRAFT_149137 [Phlyctochytrium arcticum]
MERKQAVATDKAADRISKALSGRQQHTEKALATTMDTTVKIAAQFDAGVSRAFEQTIQALGQSSSSVQKRTRESGENEMLPISKRTKAEEEWVDLRETELVSTEQAKQWARGCHTVEEYVSQALEFTRHNSVLLQQRGRHMLRLIRDAAILDEDVMEMTRKIGEMPKELTSQKLHKCAYDVHFILSTFKEQPAVSAVLRNMVRKGDLVGPSFWRIPIRTVQAGSSRLPKATIVALIETASKIDLSRNDLSEQDIRLVWAAATRAAIPIQQENIDVSLEFTHTYRAEEGKEDNMTKSDVTIAARGTSTRVGVWVAEVEKIEVGALGMGRVHKTG